MKKTEITKSAIIASTVKLLRLNGAVTVKEISDDAHVNIAAINYHFTDKQSLMEVVIRRVLSDLKQKIDVFLNSNPQNAEDIKQSIRQFFDDFYQFAFENLGIIRFMLVPSNRGLLETFNKQFYAMFSFDSEFTYKIISRMSAFGTTQSQDDLKVKYMLLFSALALPLIFKLDINETAGNKNPFPLSDTAIKEKYVEQLTKVVLG